MSESERLVSTPLGEVAVTVSGDLTPGIEPLVMWPSLLMDHSMWSPQVSHFAGRVPTIAIDPPGHGHSERLSRDFVLEDCAEVFETILDDLGLVRAHLIGNSWGAMTSAMFGALHPRRTASLVLIAGTAGTASAAQRLQFRLLLAVARMAGGMPSALNAQLKRNYFAPGICERNPEAVQEMLGQVARCDPMSVGHAVRSVVVKRRDQHAVYAKISAPTLVVSGQDDRIFPPVEGQRLAAVIPGARFHLVSNAAHLLAAEVPDTINDLLDDHLATTTRHD
jgi:3-oxoadipate enol-lactonase